MQHFCFLLRVSYAAVSCTNPSRIPVASIRRVVYATHVICSIPLRSAHLGPIQVFTNTAFLGVVDKCIFSGIGAVFGRLSSQIAVTRFAEVEFGVQLLLGVSAKPLLTVC